MKSRTFGGVEAVTKMAKPMQVVVADDWRAAFEAWIGDRSEKTVSAYMQDLEAFAAWFERANGQTFEPALMNSTDARSFRTWSLEVARVSPATWNRRRATLKVLCVWIEAAYRVELFPFEKSVKRAEEEEQSLRWLTQAEERSLMRQLEINLTSANTTFRRRRAVRDLAMVAVMRFAGLRVEETARLERGDVQISERKGSVVVRLGKRDKKRVVPLSASVRDALERWMELLPEGSSILFTDEGGLALTTRAIQKRVEALAIQCRIEGLTCHALRHTCAKSMLDAGRPLTEVQKILGHEKLETTSRYVQPGREDLEEAVEAGELGKLKRG